MSGCSLNVRLGRADELGVVVRSLGQQAEDVLGAEHGEQVGFRIAVDRRDDDGAAGPDQRRAGTDRRRGIGHVLDELHAGDDVEAARRLGRERLGGDEAVVDRGAGLQPVQPGDPQRLVGEVDAQHFRSARGHRLRQDASPAADVDDVLAFEPAGRGLDPGEPQRIELVQRAEHRAVGVPPVVRERGELGELAAIEIAGVCGCGLGHRCTFALARSVFALGAARRAHGCSFALRSGARRWGGPGACHCSLSCQSRTRAASAAVSTVVSTRSATTRWPATQTSVTASRPTTWTRCETGS